MKYSEQNSIGQHHKTMKDITPSQIVKWIAGFTVGVGVIIWLFATFMTKNEHSAYVISHKEWEQEVISQMHRDMNELRVDVKELKEGHNLILRKLDSIEARMMINKTPSGVSLNQSNIYDGGIFINN
jgi:hypothetical protein